MITRLSVSTATIWSAGRAQAGWEIVLNRAGTTFRSCRKKTAPTSTRDKAIALMLAQPSMIKRPVLEADGKLLIGFKPEIYAGAFKVR